MSSINTNRDLNYRLYVQKSSGFTRTPFSNEFSRYADIRSGDVEQVRRNLVEIKSNFDAGKGRLSDDPVRNMRYHFIVGVALVSRVCVQGGLDHNTAYTLSDIYIQRADKTESVSALLDLLEEMQLDFATRMKTLKKENVVSLHVRRCIDYIYNHLHENLTIGSLAEHAGLNASYLSKLFAKETGVSIKQFITNAKVATAENMLRYSDFSYLDISLSLGFSSQSAFISVFKKATGVTPKQYREQNYMDLEQDGVQRPR